MLARQLLLGVLVLVIATLSIPSLAPAVSQPLNDLHRLVQGPASASGLAPTAEKALSAAALSIDQGDGPNAGVPGACELAADTASATCESSPSAASASQVPSTGRPSPSPRWGASMVYDANTSDNYVLLFSGSGASDDTWTFSNGVWAELSPAIEPPQRTYAAMAYDPLAGYVVLFGGHNGANNYLGDTWKFAGDQWTELTPPVAPSARAYAAFTYDPAAGGILLFGGNNSEFSHNAGYLGDTWEFTNASNGTWTQVPTGGIDCGGFSQHNCNVTAAPSARATASMTYDARDGYAVLYGGGAANKTSLSDTWTFANGTWTDIAATAGFTKARDYTMMTFDNATADDYVLQFGGINGGDRSINTTWQFLSGSWTNLTSSVPINVSPPIRFGGAMVYDARDGYTVLFGGLSN
ncbi:MAG: kelch repeat-containing protein, partial [Thermoplasmata archaeon]